jgi:single-strand DNA-binding protein
MNSLNKVQLIGNLTANAEIRETPNGQKVASFSIATNRTWKDASGMKQEQVEFHNISAWGGLATIIEQYTSKGKKVYIEGRLQTRSWDDQAGQKKYKTEVVAENIILLSAGGAREDFEGHGDMQMDAASEASPAPKTKKSPKIEEEIHIEDIPF